MILSNINTNINLGVNSITPKNCVSFGRNSHIELNSKYDTLFAGNKHSKHTKKKLNSSSEIEVPLVEYKNTLSIALKATPDKNLREQLSLDKSIHNVDKAFNRISNLSRYLKEDMVGFVTPGGKHWFEKACTYIIKGSAGVNIPESLYLWYAVEFWSLIAKADPYWSSDEFLKYMNSLNQNPGTTATIKALEIIKNKKSFSNSNISFGYDSKLRYITKLCKDGCAYSGEGMEPNPNSPKFPSVEHIFPASAGGDDSDCNYLLTTPDANQTRGIIPLVEYLRGWDSVEYNDNHSNWRKILKKHVKKYEQNKPNMLSRFNYVI